MTTDSQPRVLSFGDFRLDCRSGELRKSRREIRLQPQPAKVLVLLASRPGEVVTRGEIQKALWGEDTFVDFEHGINFSIKQIRDALGDDAEKPRYIETVPRVGYRFVARADALAPEGGEERSPYPGLSSFSSSDSKIFFGREGEVESLRRKLESRRMLALIGPSGSGKSSFLRAGLLPSLPPGHRAVLFTPGSAPLRALTRALAPEVSGDAEAVQDLAEDAVAAATRWRKRCERALVVIDAFEELFTLNPPEVQASFASTVGRLAAEADVHVLLSIRDDFLFRCHDYEELAPVFAELTPLGPLKGPSLRRALVEPALSCGYRFESEALVEEMLREVEGERGALPLLAFAALRLWEKRDRERRLLTRDAYDEIGGVGGALAQHAEETLERIGAERTPLVREIVRNLVTSQGTRASREVEEVLSIFPREEERKATNEVLRELIAARLLTSYETSVEIIHESLLSAWPRLVRWQTQDADGAQLRDQLRHAAQMWQDRGRPDDLLWTSASFLEFQAWRARYAGGLSTTEEAFAEAATRFAGRRRHRRQMAGAAVIVVLLAVIVAIGASRQQAVTAARQAEASKLLALGQAELESYPTAALAYAITSLEIADTNVGRLFALRVLQRGPTATLTAAPPTDFAGKEAFVPAFSPNGEWLALGGWKKATVLHRTGPSRLVLGDYTDAAAHVGVAFGPESDILMTDQNGDVRIWSFPEGRELRRSSLEKGPSYVLVADEGFVTWRREGQREIIRLWPFDEGEPRLVGTMEPFGELDVSHGWLAYALGRKVYLGSLENWSSPPRLLGEHSADVRSVAFSPDGQRLAASDRSGEVRIWPVTAASVRPVRVLHGRETRYLRFDPRGNRLAGMVVGGVESEVWDLLAPPDAEPQILKRNDSSYLMRLTFDPSGDWLVTTHGDAAFWAFDESLPRVLAGHQSRRIGLVFTPDGRFLVSAAGDGVRAWPLSAEGDRASRILVPVPAGPVYATPVVDSASHNVIVQAGNGSLLVIPLSGGPSRELLACASGCFPLVLGDGGRLVATAPNGLGFAEERYVIRVIDLETGELTRLQAPPEPVDEEMGFVGLQFLGSKQILASRANKGLYLVNRTDGTSRLLAPQPRGRFVLSRDGRFVVGLTGWPEGDQDRLFELVRLELDGGVLQTLGSHGTQVSAVALDSTDTLVASGSVDGTVRIGSVSGGEPHIFLRHQGQVWSVAFSADGRWLASAGEDRQILLWPVPDLSKPPLQTRPYEEVLSLLRSRTNLRAVSDRGSATGWKVDRGPFPGWAKLPGR